MSDKVFLLKVLDSLESVRKAFQDGEKVFVNCFDHMPIEESMLDAFEEFGWAPKGKAKDEDHEIDFYSYIVECGEKELTIPKGHYLFFESWRIPWMPGFETILNWKPNNSKELWVCLERAEKTIEKRKNERKSK